MKNKHLILLCLVVALHSFSAVNAQNAALDFNNLLVDHQSLVSAKNLEYVSYSVHSPDFQTVEQKRLDVIQQIDASFKAISEKEAPEEVAKMKEEALEVLKMYKNVFTLDFVAVNELKQDRESSYEAMENYFKAQDAAEKKLSKASERFAKAQERFASKMGIELRAQEEDLKKAEEFAVINEVYSYTRNIFLIQFKVSKADAAFMDGLSEQKTVSYLVSKRSELELIAQEAVSLLKNDKGFKGDKEYKNSALALVEFFETMSKKNYYDMIELTRMQAKEQSRLTNEEIKRYNELVGIYNETITLYNLQLMKLTNAFNEENNKLLQKYVPNTGVPKGKVQRM